MFIEAVISGTSLVLFKVFLIVFTVLGKNPPDSKPNPIPNLTLTLPLTLHGGLFSGEIFS